MNLDTLDLFVEVARKRSFAAVAKERNVDPSSVSRAIADLEAELGLRLFQRTTRTMTLTEAGDVYLSRIEPLTEEIARAREAALQVTGRPRGLLRITASATSVRCASCPCSASSERSIRTSRSSACSLTPISTSSPTA
jgi:DNA-binding transcriptional LysR family regulator